MREDDRIAKGGQLGEWKEMNDVQVRGGPVSEYGMTSALLRYDEWSNDSGCLAKYA